MTLITSGAWVAEEAKRKAKRDAARKKFIADMGVTPLKSMADLSLTPSAQLPVVKELIAKANPQGSGDIDKGIAALKAAMAFTGIATGGPMANVGKALFNFANHVPKRMLKNHFGGGDDG